MGMFIKFPTLSVIFSKKCGTDPQPDGGWLLATIDDLPDGDSCPMYIKKIGAGKLRLTDNGHMRKSISDAQDIDAFLKGKSGELLETLMKDTGLRWDGNAFYLDTDQNKLAYAMCAFWQAMLQIDALRL